jgi:hypothetical protein
MSKASQSRSNPAATKEPTMLAPAEEPQTPGSSFHDSKRSKTNSTPNDAGTKTAESTVITPATEEAVQASKLSQQGGAIVTPSESSSDRSDTEEERSNGGARRALFASKTSTTSTSLISPCKRQASSSTAATTTLPPAKRRLIFGKYEYVDIVACPPNVVKVYKMVRKLTGSIGGNGYCGPIYGELTMGSMHKMIDLMITHCHLSKDSKFIDVGSGIGKPNLHVAQYPGVAFSCGVEVEQTRWSLGMTCLKAILNAAKEEERQGILDNDDSSSRIRGNCVFLHTNITDAKTFDPFTHVYMFSIGTLDSWMLVFGAKRSHTIVWHSINLLFLTLCACVSYSFFFSSILL